MNNYFSHNCGMISTQNIGQKVTISGRIEKKRDHGLLLFLDISDHTGIVQCVIDRNNNLDTFKICDSLSVASIITITGEVNLRPEGTINMEIPSGSIDVKILDVTILSKADPLPMALRDGVGEELRLEYRVLDLRRPVMKERLELRFNVIREMRSVMEEEGFMEVQTPLLTSSSPEGSRDFVVPSRLYPGQFYALPQAPQQFKQLLMVAGVHRYYQIAPCFRDEDPRADRAVGAFYQLDMEMSFATQEDVFKVIEKVMHRVFTKFSIFELTTPFPRMTYAEVMKKYATDKPDLRNPLHLVDIFDIIKDNPPRIFANIIKSNGKIAMIEYPSNQINRSFFDEMNQFAQSLGAKGLGYFERDGDIWKGSLANIMPQEVKDLVKPGNKGAFVIGHEKVDEFYKIASAIRDYLGRKLDLIERNIWAFCWITDFPMYEKSDKGWDFSHNPFSMPQGGMDALLNKDPGDILAWQYDLVCNGYEISSGAVRNHSPEIMYKAFEIAGYNRSEVDSKFGAMINAFKFGAPPHAGTAPGIERILMLLAGVKNVREVIPFPLSQSGKDLMMGAPSGISEEHLKELNLKILKP